MTRRGAQPADQTFMHAIARATVMGHLVADPRALAAFVELAGASEDKVAARLAALQAELRLPAWHWLPEELANARWAYANARPTDRASNRWYRARREGILAEAHLEGSLTASPRLPDPPDINAFDTPSEAHRMIAAYIRRLERAVADVSPTRRGGRRPSQSSIEAAERHAEWLVRHLVGGETVRLIADSELPVWSTADPGSWERRVDRGIAHARKVLDFVPTGSALAGVATKDTEADVFSGPVATSDLDPKMTS